MTTMHANTILTIQGCTREVEREARDRGEKLTWEDTCARAHALLLRNDALVRERAIAHMFRSGQIPGMRRMAAAPPAPALNPEASAMVATMLSNLIKEVQQSCQLDAAAATAAVKLAVSALAVPTMTAADDDEDDDTRPMKSAASRAASALPRFVPAGMDPITAAQRAAAGTLPMRTNTPDPIGDAARAIQAADPELSWDMAIISASQTPPRIRTRREIRQSKAGK